MRPVLKKFDNYVSVFINQLFHPCTAQRPSKVCIVCSYVCMLTAFLKIYTLDFSTFLHVAMNF